MRIETGTVRRIKILDAPDLDPISVTLEDFEAGQGKIGIDVYGTAWSNYWGAMGKQHTISTFFQKCSISYLIGKLAPGIEGTRFSNEALIALAKRTIIARRRGRHDRGNFDSLDRSEARELYDEIEWRLENVHTPSACNFESDFLAKVFHEEWWHYLDGEAQEPNPDYLYLERVIKAVQEGLALTAQSSQSAG